jgi:hypothetical protein
MTQLRIAEFLPARSCFGKAGGLRNFPARFCCILAACILPLFATVLTPFPAGFSMNTLGAIIDTRGATGRQPWCAAAFCRDSTRLGAAFCATSYYGSINDPAMYHACIGILYAGHGLTGKTAFSSFNALDVYFEETGFCSIGTDRLLFLRLSTELTGTRMRCVGFSQEYTVAHAGVSAWIPWSWAGISLSCANLVLNSSAIEGGDPTLVIRTGIHTMRTRFGNQGALVTITPHDKQPVCFAFGEEYFITPVIGFHVAASGNPLLLSFGMTITIGRSAMGVALANHPKLGWSQGVACDYFCTNTRKQGSDAK